MKLTPLAHQEIISYDGFTHSATITADDLTTAATATAQLIKLYTIPAGAIIKRVLLKLVKPFKDASDAAFNTTAVTIGDGSAVNTFVTSKELNENGTEITVPALANTPVGPYSAADHLDITFNSMTAKSLSNIDVGEALILVEIFDPNKLAAVKRQSDIVKQS